MNQTSQSVSIDKASKTGRYSFQLLLLISTVCFANIANANLMKIHMIGNSLTADAIAGLGSYTPLLELFFRGGVSSSFDYHIKFSQTLDYISQNPTSVDRHYSNGNGNNWQDDLNQNQYDLLVLQPYTGVTTASEIAAINQFSSFNIPIAIYENYPTRAEAGDISAYYQYLDPTPESDRFFRQTQTEFSQIRNAFPNATIIPAMEVLIALDSKARAGELPGVSTAQDFYLDGRHLNSIGKYILGLTFYSAITGLDPSLTDPVNSYPWYNVSSEQASIIQNTVADIVLISTPIPIPAAFWLFSCSLLSIAGAARLKKT